MKILRWSTFLKVVLLARRGQLKFPFKLTFILTKECHSKCLNCSIWQEKPSDELSLDEIKMFAKNSPFFSWVNVAGGEPTDRDDLPDIAATFKESCPNLVLFNFPTNGLKPKRIEEQVRKIANLKLPKFGVTVSIDGPAEINDRLRGIPKDFDRAVETYQRIYKIRGVDCYVGMTLYEENVQLIDELLKELQKRIPDFSSRKLHLNLPHLSEHYYNNSSRPLIATAQMIEAINKVRLARGIPRSASELIESTYQKLALRYFQTKKTPLNCAALQSSVYLSENGELYPCSIWDAPLGNIRDCNFSLLPLLEAKKTKEAREKVVNKDCPNCWTPCEAYQSILADGRIKDLISSHRE